MTGQSAEIDGYQRDRSFYGSRPNNTPKKVHRESPAAAGMAACNTLGILLYLDVPWDVEALRGHNPSLLCQRCFPPGGGVL